MEVPQDQIDRINKNIADTYAVLETMGAAMPAKQNSDNLAATAASLTSVEAGEWTPTCPAFSSPTAAHGYYTKIGDMVTISWFISGTSDSAATDSYSLAIYGLPYQPDTNVRWFGGGGNIANAETQGNHAFCGYVIDHMSEKGSCIVPRTTAVTTSRASRGTLYAMNSNGKTIIMAGSLMYKIKE